MKISTQKFLYNKDTKTFSAEMSELADRNKKFPASFDLVSHVTGKAEEFKFNKFLWNGTNEDRELGGWEFLPISPELKKNNITVVIFND